MQGNDDNKKYLGGLDICGTKDRIKVPDKEDTRKGEADCDKDPVHDGYGRPGNQSHGDPNQICISIQSDAFEQVGALGTEPLQRTPQGHGDEEGIPIDQTRSTRQQGEVINEVFLSLFCQILRDCASEEEDDDNGGCDPKGTVQIGIAV